MVGNIPVALQRGRDLFAAAGVVPVRHGVAVDLGCGSRLQAIPLAERGHEVAAIDLCARLLAELCDRAGTLPLRTVQGDLLGFPRHLTAPADLTVCMGDTLPHLPTTAAVDELLRLAAADLALGGKLALTFRDHVTHIHVKDARWNPAKDDADYAWPGEGDGAIRRILADALARGYDGGISIEPHMVAVFHGAAADAQDDTLRANFVEYGRRLERLIAEIRAGR